MATVKISSSSIDVSTEPDDGFHILMRGGKPLLTPAGKPYRLPSPALAEAIAGEWFALGEKKPSPAAIPLSMLAATAIDIIASSREDVIAAVLAYSASDLLCHRAEQPAALAARQEELWQPLLEWCAVRFGALLRAGTGIIPVPQKSEAISALRSALDSRDDFALAGVKQAVETTGSLILGLALAEGERDAASVFNAAELDAQFQAMTWGVDPAARARFDSILKELEYCERWFRLLRR